MKKILLILLFLLIVIFSSVIVFNILSEDSKNIKLDDDQDYSTEDIIDEINNNLLYEYDEVEIGEII